MLLVSSSVVAALLLTVMILVFIGSFYFNHKTKIPEGCKLNRPECKGCSIFTCPSRQKDEEEKETVEVVKTIDMDREAMEELKKNMKD